MVTLVTGVPGWVGTRLLQELARKNKGNDSLRAFALNGQDLSDVRRLTGDIVIGDLRNQESLKPALEDVDTVFHIAAILYSSRAKDFYDVNTKGTKDLLDLSLSAGVKRFIHVSSDSAVGWNPRGVEMVDETTPPRPHSDYGMSKWLAEKEVNRAHEKHGLETTIIRPCWIYGPGLSQNMSDFIRTVAKGRAPLVGKEGALQSMSYVDDVVTGLLLARRLRRAIGKTYYIAHDRPFSASEVYSAIAEGMGVPLRVMRLPGALPKISELLHSSMRRLGLDVWAFRILADFGHDISCSVKKVEQDLGFRSSVTLREGMANSIAWGRAQGLW